MVKVFISQPMRGRSQDEIEEERDELFADVACMLAEKGEDCREVPSYLPTVAEQMGELYCLGASIQLLADADVAVFAKGWEKSRRCRVERECAELYGVEVVGRR